MDQEFKKLFSGLLDNAGAKADEGKALLKSAIDKITRTATSVDSTDVASTGRKPTGKQPSAFQQNLLKLKQYEASPDDDDASFDMTPPPMDEMPALVPERGPAEPALAVPSKVRPPAAPLASKPAAEKRPAVRGPKKKRVPAPSDVAPSLSSGGALEPRLKPTTAQAVELTEAIAKEKRALADRFANWRQTLAEDEGVPIPHLDESAIAVDEALIERIQSVLDLIAGQIAQVQAKKNEIEAQKLLFDSTASTMLEEREAYRRSIERFTEQITQKHEELGNYLRQWESDTELWAARKKEIDRLRGQSLQTQQHYQQSIADYVDQIESRRQTLQTYEVQLTEQADRWRQLSDAIADLQAESEATQTDYRQRITDYVEKLQSKQRELEAFMGDWEGRLLAWSARIDTIDQQSAEWETRLDQTQARLEQTRELVLHDFDERCEHLETTGEKLSAWHDERTLDLTRRKAELSALFEQMLQSMDLCGQQLSIRQTSWGADVETRLTEQQQRFDEALSRLNALASQQIDEMTEKLAEANELYLTLYREHQKQLAETLASRPDIVTESIWRNRLSYAIAFLPQLPVYISADDLSVLFGGIDVRFKSPYTPPTESTVQVKWQLFERLPVGERHAISALCRDIATNYRIDCHPIAQTVTD